MNDQKNTILAIVLSALVLIVWQYFFGLPQIEKQKQQVQQQQQQQAQPLPAPAGQPQVQSTAPQAPGQPSTVAPGAPGQPLTRDAAIAASPRVLIETPSLKGSLALKGGRIDDLSLIRYRETVNPGSPAIVLLSPSGSPQPFYAEFGWVGAAATPVKVPGPETVWRQEGSGALGVGRPVTLVWDNGEGLEFRRTITIDENYLFSLKDEVANRASEPVTLYPYALISRHGTPSVLGYYILHEGLVGVLKDKLEEITYADIEKQKNITYDTTNAWLGITDKYWAAALLPNTDAHLKARFAAGALGSVKTYQSDYLLDARTIQPGATGSANARLFAVSASPSCW